jgi:oligopeptide/dipeptide ABC transporter ATP-binding protein
MSMPVPSAAPQVEESTPTAEVGSRLVVKDLRKHFPIRGGVFSTVRETVKAVDGVSFEIPPARTLGLVGESGCGKTTVGRALLRLIPATSGRVMFGDKNVLTAGGRDLRELRRKMQIIFQDPYGSLNPRMTIEQIVGEGIWLHGLAKGREIRDRVADLLKQTGLRPEAMTRYPHEFSGGQRQRVGIARALSVDPKFIVCDEPTSALDVSIRAQIINLLQDLREARGLSYLMISHDLGVVRHISDEVAVMYLGKIVEQAPVETLFGDTRHPYSLVLLTAIPVPNPKLRGTRTRIRSADADDTIPSPVKIPSGCPFHPRCPLYHAKGKPEECRTTIPELWPAQFHSDHLVACHFRDQSPEDRAAAYSSISTSSAPSAPPPG